MSDGPQLRRILSRRPWRDRALVCVRVDDDAYTAVCIGHRADGVKRQEAATQVEQHEHATVNGGDHCLAEAVPGHIALHARPADLTRR
jgi:hypothetical protein